MNDKILAGISFVCYLIAGTIFFVLVVVLNKACTSAENEAEDKNIPIYETHARKWLGDTEAKVHCHRWGRCDIIPSPPLQPYRLICTNENCQLAR